MNAFIKYILLALFITLTAIVKAAGPAEQLIQVNARTLSDMAKRSGIEPSVNDSLMKHQRNMPLSLQQITPRVAVRTGEYSVYSFVEGDKGIIAVDAGFFVNETRQTFSSYQEQYSSKPIKAIIYTHSHGDHVYGTQGLLGNIEDPEALPVFGPKDWDRNTKYESGPRMGMVLERAYSQMGFLLPKGVVGNIGSGIGGAMNIGQTYEGLPVNYEITKRTERRTIEGVDFTFLNLEGDIPETLAVYLEQDKVLFVGDVLDGTFLPYMSARWEPGRTIQGYQKSIESLMQKFPDAEHLVSGHGVITSGREAIRNRLKNARDLSKYVEDYTNRAALLGWTHDEVIENFSLPPRLASDPHLQTYYHRLDWILRGAYVMKIGPITDINSLTRWTDSVEIPRMVEMMGGRDRVFASAEKAFAEKDPRWVVTLCSWLLKIDSNDLAARDLQKKALLAIAYSSSSANERNYVLSDVLDLPWAKLVGPTLVAKLNKLSEINVLERWSTLLNHTQAHSLNVAIEVNIADESLLLTVREGILDVTKQTGTAPVDTTLTMSRVTLDQISAGVISLSGAVDKGLVEVSGSHRVLNNLAELMQSEPL